MAETPNNSRGWLWLGIPIALMLVALVAMNMYLLLRDDSDKAATEKPEVPQKSAAPIYVNIDPFTVNLQGDLYASRLLYMGLSLQVGDEDTREFLQENMPQVRSRLLVLNSAQNPEVLATPEGKEQLAEAIIARLSEPMAAGQPELHIDDVLFTEFIVQ